MRCGVVGYGRGGGGRAAVRAHHYRATHGYLDTFGYLGKGSIAHTVVCAILEKRQYCTYHGKCAILAERAVLHIQVSIVLQIPGQVRSSESPERK